MKDTDPFNVIVVHSAVKRLIALEAKRRPRAAKPKPRATAPVIAALPKWVAPGEKILDGCGTVTTIIGDHLMAVRVIDDRNPKYKGRGRVRGYRCERDAGGLVFQSFLDIVK